MQSCCRDPGYRRYVNILRISAEGQEAISVSSTTRRFLFNDSDREPIYAPAQDRQHDRIHIGVRGKRGVEVTCAPGIFVGRYLFHYSASADHVVSKNQRAGASESHRQLEILGVAALVGID